MSKIERKKNIGSLALLRPRVTEKATALSVAKVPSYVFEIPKGYNKNEVKKAVKEVYGVTPSRVNITKTASKKVFIRGKRGVKSGVIKAVVYLKKGDKIEFV